MQKFFRNQNIAHGVFIVLFVVFFGTGLLIYDDYGVSVDEYSQIEIGRVNYARITTGSRELETSYDRFGPAFETALYAATPVVQRVLKTDFMQTRHLLVFLYVAASVCVFYVFLWRLTGSCWYGILGTVFLVLSPRQFAQGFYNSKDMVFLSTGIFLLYSLRVAVSFGWPALMLHGALSGYALAVRPQGSVFIAASIVGIALATKKPFRHTIGRVAVYLGMTIAAAYACMPVLWGNPLAQAAGMFSRSLDPVGVPTLYFGRWYVSPNIPWHYLPVMIGITSPLYVVFFSVAGMFWFVLGNSRKTWAYRVSDALYVVMLFVVAETLGFAISLHAREYDGWRHVYYIYPSLIGFCVYTVQKLGSFVKKHKGTFPKIIVGSILVYMVVDMTGVMLFMWKNHPYQYVYFNRMAGGYPDASKNFDFDYWGISYKQIAEYIRFGPLRGGRIYVREQFPYVQNVMIPMLQKMGYRIVQTPLDADIFITVYRNTKAPPPSRFSNIYSVSVGGASLSAVYVSDAYRVNVLERVE